MDEGKNVLGVTVNLLMCRGGGVYTLQSRGLQRDVVYLCGPLAPSYMSPNAGGGGKLRGLSMSTAVHRSPNKLWRSNSIFNQSTE